MAWPDRNGLVYRAFDPRQEHVMDETIKNSTNRMGTAIATAMRVLGHRDDGRRRWGERFPFDRVGAVSLACATLMFAITLGLAVALH
jgi:hypothetical protein